MTRRLATVAAALLLLSSCYRIRFEHRGAAEPGAPRELWHHGLLGGLIEASGPVDLGAMCPNGIVSVENVVTPLQTGIQIIATGAFGAVQAVKVVPGILVLQAPLWEPSLVRVTCAKDGVSRAASGATKKLKIALLSLVALGDVDADTVRLLSEALAGELRKRPGLQVLAQSDISALLGLEKTKEMLGCTDAGCIAEVGGALGVDRIVHGSIGRVGSSLLVNISSLDAKKGAHAASVSERLKGSTDEGFLDALPRIVDDLLAEAR
jgi:TolB-like protein